MDRRIAFIGLGTTGAPMAWNSRKAGYELGVWNRSETPTHAFSRISGPLAGLTG